MNSQTPYLSLKKSFDYDINSAIKLTEAISEVTAEYHEPFDDFNNDQEVWYNLAFGNAIPSDLRDSFEILRERFQKSMEKSINSLTQIDLHDSFLPFALYRTYDQLLKDAILNISKHFEECGVHPSLTPQYTDESVSCLPSATILKPDDMFVHVEKNNFSSVRRFTSKETRDLLEEIFKVKRRPNRTERHLIAEKCGLTPLQVRIWFSNKRVRSK